MQYLVLAFDETDEAAIERRLMVGPDHIARAKSLKEAGELHIGGPILDDSGKAIGSAQFVEFETPDGIERYVKDDPFTKGKVWKDVKVFKVLLRECRCVTQMRHALCSGSGGSTEIVDLVSTVVNIPLK